MKNQKGYPVYGGVITGGPEMHTKTCPVCGKNFPWNSDHVYKILMRGNWRPFPVCTWGCQRKAEKLGIAKRGQYNWHGTRRGKER